MFLVTLSIYYMYISHVSWAIVKCMYNNLRALERFGKWIGENEICATYARIYHIIDYLFCAQKNVGEISFGILVEEVNITA